MSLRRLNILVVLLLGTSLFTVLGQPAEKAAAAGLPCTTNELLVNSCRPWFGASSNGYAETGSDLKSQALYFEQRAGRQMDMVHQYHGVGNQANYLSATDLYFANRPDTLLYLNWPLTNTFSQGAGGDATTNAYIDQMANSIKTLGEKKILLTLHHEPENDIAFTCPGQSTKPGTMGTAAEYVAMWHNVRARFDALGVQNVVWVMNYMNYGPYDCMINDLWPGNDYVDYVSFNGYHSTDQNVSFEYEVGRFYDFLLANSTPEHDYASKEWGIVEWGIHSSTQANAYLYYQQAKQAVENHVFPRLRFYMIFDNGDRNRNIWDFQVAYDRTRVYDAREQEEFNLYANSWALTGDGTPPGEPVDSAAPTVPTNVEATLNGGRPLVTWNASTDNVGVTGYDVLRDGSVVGTTTELAFSDTTAPLGTSSYTVQARDAAGNTSDPSASASVSVGDATAPTSPTNVAVTLSNGRPRVTWNASTDNVGVTGYQVLRDGTVIGTTTTGRAYTDAGAPQGRTYSYTVQARDAAGNTSDPSTAVSLTVPDTTAPGTPSSLRVVRNSGTRATLTWGSASDNVAVTNYLLYRGSTLVATVGSTTRSTSVSGLASGATYTFTVRARDAAGNLGAGRSARG